MEAPTELVEGGEQFVEDADSIDYTMEALTSSGYSKKTVEKVRTFLPSFFLFLGRLLNSPSVSWAQVVMAKFTIEQFYTNFFRSLKDRNDRYAAQLSSAPPLSLLCISHVPTKAQGARSGDGASGLARREEGEEEAKARARLYQVPC